MKIKHGLAAFAILGAATVAGCAPGVGANSGAYSNPGTSYASNDACTASPDIVHVYPTTNGTGVHVFYVPKGGNRVFGDVYITCSPKPRNQITRVELWFHKLGTSTWDIENYTQQKIVPTEQGVLFSTSTPCVPGMYQVRWSVVGTDSESEHFVRSSEWKTAQITLYNCANPKGSPQPTQTGDGPVYG